jgi:crossover junction endodeoxyribonuclease RuvC
VIYIGIDPGKKGGFAMIKQDDSGQQTIDVYPWDDSEFVHKMRTLAEDDDARKSGIVTAVEKVGAMHGQGVTSMFSFGHSLGFIEGVLSGCWISYQLVPPNVWKKSFSLIGKDKQASIDTCKRLVPGINLLPNDRCRKDSDGMAESVLIALYAQRNFK